MTIEAKIRATKLRLLKMHHHANHGHLGGNMSCIDALVVLYHQVIQPADQFILSKGHSAGALYAALWSAGKLTDEDLDTFCQDGGLPAHPVIGVPGVDFHTGSLGHGPSLAAGMALAAKHSGSDRRVYCLCGDGEWQEGSCWEALSFAVYHRLDNLTILIDQNGWQGFGRVHDVISKDDLMSKIKVFGAYVLCVDGHNPDAMRAAVETHVDQPSVIILDTIKGHGLHFENTLESHYLPLTDEEYRAACEALQEDQLL